MANPSDWKSFWRASPSQGNDPDPKTDWGAFWGGAGSTGEKALNDSVGRAQETGDGGLFGFAKKVADKAGLDSAANVVMKGLEIADLGRAAIVAGGAELADGLSALTGGESDIRQTDRVQQSGFSFDDFMENVKNHVGVGDLLEADRSTKGMNIWGKRALGFLGDVAADPLTYVSGGASIAGKGAGKTLGLADDAARGVGRRTLVSNQDVATRLLRAGDEAGAEAVAGGRSAAAVDRAATEAVGIDRGIYAAGFRVRALDGVYDSFSRARGRARARAAQMIVDRVTPERWVKFETVPGTALIRNNEALKAQGIANVKALEWTIGWRDARNSAKRLKADYGTRLNELFTQFKDADKDALRRAIEAGDTSVPGAAEFSQFFDDIIRDVNEVTGSTIPSLKNYLTHIMTDEAKEGLGKVGKGQNLPGFVRKRGIDKTIDEQNEAFREFLLDGDEALRAKFGDELPDFFKTDTFEISKEYLDQVERFVRMRSFERAMQDAGLAVFFNRGAVRKAIKANKGHLRQAAKLGRKSTAAEGRRQKAKGKAATVAADIANEPFVPAAQGRAVAKGSDSILAGIEADDLGRQVDEIDSTLDELADEASNLAEMKAGALAQDPAEQLAAAQAKLGEREVGLHSAQDARTAAQSELDELEAIQPPETPQPAPGGDVDALVAERKKVAAEVDALKARQRRGAKPKPDAEPELMTVGERKAQALAHLKSIGAPPKALAEARAQFENDLRDTLLKEIEAKFGLPTTRAVEAVDEPVEDLAEQIAAKDAQRKSLTEAIKELKKAQPEPAPVGVPDDLATRITAAKKRVAAATGREARAAKAVEKAVATVEEHQAVLETEYVSKGEVAPLIEQNRARVAEMTDERRQLSKAKRKARNQELALRTQADELYAAAASETDPRLAQHARFEAQARQAEADAYRHRGGQVAEYQAMKVIKPRDLELAAAAAKDQIAQINRYSNLWADPETAKAFTALADSLRPEKIGKILRLHDTVMSRWKAYSLLSPGYHWRNGYSAMFMNDVAGYSQGSAGYFAVERGMRKALKAGNIEAGLKGVNEKWHQPLRELWEMRGPLFGEQGLGADFGDVYTQAGRRRGILPVPDKIDPTSLDNVALKANTTAAGWVERNVRGALFVDSIMKGMTREEAYERVIRFHFDYSEGISQFEKRVMRRVVPFYTWTRLNFPLQLEYMARRPGVYTKYTHAKNNLELGTEEEQFVPSYMGELGAIRLPVEIGGDRMYVAPDLPFLRLGQTLDVDQAMAQLSPIIKTPLEVRGGKRFFNDIPFKQGYQEVPGSWVGVGELLHLAGGKLGLPKVEKIDGKYFFTDEAQMYKVEQALPLLGKMRRAIPANDPAAQDRQLSSWLSLGVGLTTLTNTPRQQENEMRRRQAEIDDLVAAFNRRQEAKG